MVLNGENGGNGGPGIVWGLYSGGSASFGGGVGGRSHNVDGYDATPNTGGGGGGGGGNNTTDGQAGGHGGSGVVIIRYLA